MGPDYPSETEQAFLRLPSHRGAIDRKLGKIRFPGLQPICPARPENAS